ncbi:protein of unknown function [Candidatus Filomicrobium marinum]|nr:protein of unknown function [Candidatus Filomicrobium marinum]
MHVLAELALGTMHTSAKITVASPPHTPRSNFFIAVNSPIRAHYNADLYLKAARVVLRVYSQATPKRSGGAVSCL